MMLQKAMSLAAIGVMLASPVFADDLTRKSRNDWISRPLVEEEKAFIRNHITIDLYDPFSVRFRWGRAHLVERKRADKLSYLFETCVWFNARNLNGAYTGFKPAHALLFRFSGGDYHALVDTKGFLTSNPDKVSLDEKCRRIGFTLYQTELEPLRDQ
jgi:hypothetical protein